MPLRVYVESLGCKLNQCERDGLAEQFVLAGQIVVARPEEADVCVVNTCAVTHVAERKSRQRFRQLRRANPGARLVATGCAARLANQCLEVDLMVDNAHKDNLPAQVLEAWGDMCAALPVRPSEAAASVVHPRTRALVKIQDGCDNACTYCIVRILRGRQKSRPRDEILAEVAELVRNGRHEVVLTGVHVGAYGRDNGDTLVDLVSAILRQSPPSRLRLSSIEPWDLTPAFFALWRDSRLCRHLHLPLQSGCDATLDRMNRKYTSGQFAELIEQARAAVPGLAVTTDVIAGFPGESEAEFAESAAFIERMTFARVHVFPYSPRPGTPAARMPDQVDPQIRRDRARTLREIARRSSAAFREQFLGQVMDVLWESRVRGDCWTGLTDNYIRVSARSSAVLANELRKVRLVALEANGVHGTLCG